jgi:hypothetical protein
LRALIDTQTSQLRAELLGAMVCRQAPIAEKRGHRSS